MSSHNDITIVNGVNTKYINDDIAVDQIESLNLLRLVYQVAGQTSKWKLTFKYSWEINNEPGFLFDSFQ